MGACGRNAAREILRDATLRRGRGRLLDVRAQVPDLLALLLDLVAHQIAHREHRDHAAVVDHRQMPAARPLHLLETAVDALVEPGGDDLVRHHLEHARGRGSRPATTTRVIRSRSEKMPDQALSLDDRDGADAALAHGE